MSKRQPKSRAYWREDRGGYYADYRDYAAEGGKQREALIVPGDTHATTNKEIADVLAGKRLAELNKLRARRQGRAVHGLPKETTLADFARKHLIAKAESGKVTERWLDSSERFTDRAITHFGATRALEDITPEDMRGWAAALQRRGLSGGTVRHHLNAASNLYRRAQSEGYAPAGYNPVAALMEKPSANREEARWLEVHDAALLLEAARLYIPKRDDIAMPFAHPLIATFLLSGGRRLEVLGLEVDDISLKRRTVTFRQNKWRRLKTLTSFRAIPLLPQLERILKAYFPQREQMGGGTLLFPSFRTGGETMLTDFRKLLDAVAVRAGWKPGELTSKMFRHTYCAARLQTLDNDAPVSPYTVAKELGHGGDAMVKRVYAHLGEVRHRSKVVEYRVNQHRKVLGDRLKALRSVTNFVTTEQPTL